MASVSGAETTNALVEGQEIVATIVEPEPAAN
jgi:hypothetical protein